jgi:hypothetical protein
MSSLAAAEEENTGVLEDPVSFEPYKTPTRILPCGHTLNHDTLVGLLIRANIDDEDNRYFVCPLDRQRCRVKPADEFPQNFQLEQQIERFKEREIEIEQRLKEKMKKEMDDNLKAMELSLHQQEELQRKQTEKLKTYKLAKKDYLETRDAYLQTKDALLKAESKLRKVENDAKEVGLNIVSVITEQVEEETESVALTQERHELRQEKDPNAPKRPPTAFVTSETSTKKARSHRNPLIPSTSRKVAVRTNLDRYKQIMARLRDNTGPTYIYALKRGDENYNTFKKLVNNNNDFKILRDVEEDLKGGITESFVSDIEFLYKLILKFYSEIEKIPEVYLQHIEYMLGELDTMKTIMLAVCSLEPK